MLLAQMNEQSETIQSAEQTLDSFKEFQQILDNPTAEMVNALVEAVYVFGNDRIEVRFSFMDELEQAIIQIKNMGVEI